jgi:glyoxylase-like metal-dependent hydrolase (beta-lactamase superfamily II)
VAIVLTVFWHERSAGHVFERYSKTLGARVYAHESGIGRIECAVSDPFREGDRLPGGIEWFEAKRADEVVLWLPNPRALAAGDILLGREHGLRLCPPEWIGGADRLEAARAALRPLTDLPVEMVLVSHGPPVLSGGRDALAQVLDPAEPAE